MSLLDFADETAGTSAINWRKRRQSSVSRFSLQFRRLCDLVKGSFVGGHGWRRVLYAAVIGSVPSADGLLPRNICCASMPTDVARGRGGA